MQGIIKLPVPVERLVLSQKRSNWFETYGHLWPQLSAFAYLSVVGVALIVMYLNRAR